MNVTQIYCVTLKGDKMFEVGNEVQFEYKGRHLQGTISRIYNSGYTASIVSGKSMYTMPVCAIKHINENTYREASTEEVMQSIKRCNKNHRELLKKLGDD